MFCAFKSNHCILLAYLFFGYSNLMKELRNSSLLVPGIHATVFLNIRNYFAFSNFTAFFYLSV
ncbi:MAG: hypothetical protein CFE21_21625 [Bacteroidetes bacterium B1(2017)]|nr:MAG: hypothetical protein CFE21_21625 [Bacteroidetes bacterium B1(2017)]